MDGQQLREDVRKGPPIFSRTEATLNDEWLNRYVPNNVTEVLTQIENLVDVEIRFRKGRYVVCGSLSDINRVHDHLSHERNKQFQFQMSLACYESLQTFGNPLSIPANYGFQRPEERDFQRDGGSSDRSSSMRTSTSSYQQERESTHEESFKSTVNELVYVGSESDANAAFERNVEGTSDRSGDGDDRISGSVPEEEEEETRSGPAASFGLCHEKGLEAGDCSRSPTTTIGTTGNDGGERDGDKNARQNTFGENANWSRRLDETIDNEAGDRFVNEHRDANVDEEKRITESERELETNDKEESYCVGDVAGFHDDGSDAIESGELTLNDRRGNETSVGIGCDASTDDACRRKTAEPSDDAMIVDPDIWDYVSDKNVNQLSEALSLFDASLDCRNNEESGLYELRMSAAVDNVALLRDHILHMYEDSFSSCQIVTCNVGNCDEGRVADATRYVNRKDPNVLVKRDRDSCMLIGPSADVRRAKRHFDRVVFVAAAGKRKTGDGRRRDRDTSRSATVEDREESFEFEDGSKVESSCVSSDGSSDRRSGFYEATRNSDVGNSAVDENENVKKDSNAVNDETKFVRGVGVVDAKVLTASRSDDDVSVL